MPGLVISLRPVEVIVLGRQILSKRGTPKRIGLFGRRRTGSIRGEIELRSIRRKRRRMLVVLRVDDWPEIDRRLPAGIGSMAHPKIETTGAAGAIAVEIERVAIGGRFGAQIVGIGVDFVQGPWRAPLLT